MSSHWKYILFMGLVCIVTSNAASVNRGQNLNSDLKTASSSYSSQYFELGKNNPGSYGFAVTGTGVIDDQYSRINSYDNNLLERSPFGYESNGNDARYGPQDYDNYKQYSIDGYNRNADYAGFIGNGGYGGHGGNGGLESYYGYNNPYYQEANHLGYGYYGRVGYGNIYSGGVTPNLVTGYRGYSRR